MMNYEHNIQNYDEAATAMPDRMAGYEYEVEEHHGWWQVWVWLEGEAAQVVFESEDPDLADQFANEVDTRGAIG